MMLETLLESLLPISTSALSVVFAIVSVMQKKKKLLTSSLNKPATSELRIQGLDKKNMELILKVIESSNINKDDITVLENNHEIYPRPENDASNC